jgi:hypothetical protein
MLWARVASSRQRWAITKSIAAVSLSLLIALSSTVGLFHHDRSGEAAGPGCVEPNGAAYEPSIHSFGCNHDERHHDPAACFICRSLSHAKTSLPSTVTRLLSGTGYLTVLSADDSTAGSGQRSCAVPRAPPVLS